MAKNIYAVTFQTELVKKEEGKPIQRSHGGEFSETVIASSPESASAYVRAKHTSNGQRVLRCGASLVFSGLEYVPVAADEEPVSKTTAPPSSKA